MSLTRQRIKVEAMRLFVAHGVDAVSVRDIAAAVGMKASNLYAHFPSRAALIRELFSEGFRFYAEALGAVTGPTCLARLEAMIVRICALHDEDVVRFRFLLLTQHTALADLPDGAANPIALFEALIAEAMARREIAAGDPALATAMVTGAIIQAATFRLYGRLDRDLAELAGELAAASRRLLGRDVANHARAALVS